MAEGRTNPYIWVTWLTKLMVGENSCEWAVWFRAQHESWSWEKISSDFDVTNWQIKHTALVGQIREQLEREGKTVFVGEPELFHAAW